MNIAVTRGIVAGINEAILLLGGYVHSEEAFLEACAEKYKPRWEIGANVLRKTDRKSTGIVLPNSSEN